MIGSLGIAKLIIVFELEPKNYFQKKPFLASDQKKPQRNLLALPFQVYMDPNIPRRSNARNITSQLQGVVERPFLKGRSQKTPQRKNARKGFSSISIPTLTVNTVTKVYSKYGIYYYILQVWNI